MQNVKCRMSNVEGVSINNQLNQPNQLNKLFIQQPVSSIQESPQELRAKDVPLNTSREETTTAAMQEYRMPVK